MTSKAGKKCNEIVFASAVADPSLFLFIFSFVCEETFFLLD